MSRIKVIFPSVLTSVTKGRKNVEVSGSTLNEVFGRLIEEFGDPFREKIFDKPGQLKRLLNLYVNGKNIDHLKGLETQLKDGDEVTVLPAVAGG